MRTPMDPKEARAAEDVPTVPKSALGQDREGFVIPLPPEGVAVTVGLSHRGGYFFGDVDTGAPRSLWGLAAVAEGHRRRAGMWRFVALVEFLALIAAAVRIVG